MTAAAARAALHFACPGSIGQPTGGYRYDAEILRGMQAGGRDIVLHELAGRFPEADRAATDAARACVVPPARTTIARQRAFEQ